MKFVDAFAGVGGFRLGLEQLGHECVASIEKDKHARETYTANFGGDNLHCDIYDVAGKDLPQFDILTGGFPCQPFSVAGHRKGTADERGVLFLEIIRLAREGKPKVVISENVKGILSERHGEMRKAFIAELDELGYDTQYDIFTASDFGVPQKRERVFFVSVLRGSGVKWKPPIAFAPPTCKLADILEPEDEVAEKYYLSEKALSGMVAYKSRHEERGNGFGFSVAEIGGARKEVHSRTLNATDSQTKRQLVQVGYINKNQQGNRVYNPDGLGRCLGALGGGWGALTGLYQVGYLGGEGKAGSGNGWPGKRIYSSEGELGMTITSAGGGYVGLYATKSGVRRLTPREAFRLMGFPDSYRLLGSDTQQYKQAGNAVVPQVARAVAEGLYYE